MSVEASHEQQAQRERCGLATGSSPGIESGISQPDRELMELEAEEHATIAQWLRGYYESPTLAAQHEAKAEAIRRQMAYTSQRQPDSNVQEQPTRRLI
jgi:hypothetical protein